MTLDQLRYFQAVCQYGSVSRASDFLHISQPSVSAAISNLEKEFNVALFTRQHKRLLLTKEGHLLLDLTDKLLVQAEDIHATMLQLGRKSKVLRLGIPPMIGSLFLPALYDTYFKQHPQLQVHITEGDNSELRRYLADGQIDMAFLPHTHPFDDSLQAEYLTVFQNVCCVSNAHPLASQSSVRLADLINEPMVLFKNSFFQTERILDAFSRMGCTPNVILHTAQLSTIQNMIAGNSAIGFMFQPLLRSIPQGIVGLPLDPPMTTQVSLAWKTGTHLSKEMIGLLCYLKDHFGQNTSP